MAEAGVEGVTISGRSQEKSVPESQMLEGPMEALNKPNRWSFLRNATSRSTTKLNSSPDSKVYSGSFRPLSERNERARLREEVHKINRNRDLSKEEKKLRKEQVLAEAHARDEIAHQYLNQGEVRVTLPALGEQSVRYTIINPPEYFQTPQTASKPPIFLIPGIVNDLESMVSLIQEIPVTGRRVIALGFPGGFMSKVTAQFTSDLAASPSFEPYVEFFKKAVDAFVGQDGEAELWGHSNGAVIVEMILNDPTFQKKVPNAVLLCPASSSDNLSPEYILGPQVLGKRLMGGLTGLGVFNETWRLLLQHFKEMPKYSMVNGRKVGDDPAQKPLRDAIFDNLLRKVTTKMNCWQGARVKVGGKIVVVSADQDEMTRSFETFSEKDQTLKVLRSYNPQIDVIELKDGSHFAPLIKPKEVISKIQERQKAA